MIMYDENEANDYVDTIPGSVVKNLVELQFFLRQVNKSPVVNFEFVIDELGRNGEEWEKALSDILNAKVQYS